MDFKQRGGPDIPFDGSFAETMNRFGSTTKDVPPTHPSDNLSYVSDQEVRDYVDKKTSRNLFTMGKYRCSAALFDLSKSEQLEAYELVQNNALHKGWVIAVEERQWPKEGGGLIAFLKYLIPVDNPQERNSSKPSP